jgi:hypothetical protein
MSGKKAFSRTLDDDGCSSVKNHQGVTDETTTNAEVPTPTSSSVRQNQKKDPGASSKADLNIP